MGLPDKSFKADANIAAQVERQSNIGDPDQHNNGQPVRQNLDVTGHQRSKFITACAKEHKNSLECINENYERREVCQPFFDAYKVCRKAEHERKMEENARLSGGNGESCIIS